MAETRKLAAILAADIVGYSRLTQADEDRTLARIRALRSDLIDPTIAVHHGRIVKRTGDGAIVEFRSVVDAVACAREVQNAMIDRNAGLPDDQRIQFRMGVHVGDVVEESDGDLMGDGVNIAARLEGVAKPGAICLSSAAYEQVKGRLDVKISDLGLTPLKNISEPVRVYSLEVGAPGALKRPIAAKPSGVTRTRLALAGALAVALIVSGTLVWRLGLTDRLLGVAASEDKLANAPHLSIVALPFTNLSGDPEQDYFADGITEDITTDLSYITGSFVIARNTAFTYKGKSVDVKQIGRDLGVRYVLEGSVRRQGETVTVNAQLISTETGSHIWADRFEGSRDKIGQLQVDIVGRLANSLGFELRRAEDLRASRLHPSNPDAVDLAMKGELALGRMDNKEAKDIYEQALKLDPNLQQAQGGLAVALANLAGYPGANEREAYLDRAEKLVDQIATRTPNDPGARWARAWVLAADKQIDAAILEGEAAIKNDPNLAGVYGSLGLWKGMAGRAEEGFADVATAMKLSPRDPILWLWEWTVCDLHLKLAQWEQAIAPCQKAAAENPNLWQAHFNLAEAYGWLGREAEAKAEIVKFLKAVPGSTVKGVLSYAKNFSDNPVYLQQTARQVEGLRKAGLQEQ